MLKGTEYDKNFILIILFLEGGCDEKFVRLFISKRSHSSESSSPPSGQSPFEASGMKRYDISLHKQTVEKAASGFP